MLIPIQKNAKIPNFKIMKAETFADHNFVYLYMYPIYIYKK